MDPTLLKVQRPLQPQQPRVRINGEGSATLALPPADLIVTAPLAPASASEAYTCKTGLPGARLSDTAAW